MLDQIYAIQKVTGERVSHLVVMGTGEPFDNFESLCRMIELLCSPEGLNISHRNITVSTCGIVPKIYEFADRNPQVTLAISLHSPNDTMRKELMPIANKYSMDELMKAAKYYTKTTGRRITFEYSLVKGVNDKKEHAEELISREMCIRDRLRCHYCGHEEVFTKQCPICKSPHVAAFGLGTEKVEMCIRDRDCITLPCGNAGRFKRKKYSVD